MTTPAPPLENLPNVADTLQITRAQGILRGLWTAPLSAKLGLLIILVYVFVALFAPWIAPFGESEIVGKKYLPWGTRWALPW